MTVDEMAAIVERDLEGWLSRIGVVAVTASGGLDALTGDQKVRASVTATRLAGMLIVGREWKRCAVSCCREQGFIPDSCKSIESTCHALAHVLADKVNEELGLSGELIFRCSNFCFFPHGHPAFEAGAAPPSFTERIKFSHN